MVCICIGLPEVDANLDVSLDYLEGGGYRRNG